MPCGPRGGTKQLQRNVWPGFSKELMFEIALNFVTTLQRKKKKDRENSKLKWHNMQNYSRILTWSDEEMKKSVGYLYNWECGNKMVD